MNNMLTYCLIYKQIIIYKQKKSIIAETAESLKIRK